MSRPAPGPGEDKTMLVPRRDVDADLRRGTALAQYVIEQRIGVGGHGIVYRAHDTALQRTVAIKEYMPATLATRTPEGRVVPRHARHEPHFALGLTSFLNEAKLLAFFDHPALIKVYQFWPENGTAYMAMTLLEGITLKQWLKELGAPPSEEWLRAMAAELIDVLALALESPNGDATHTDGSIRSERLRQAKAYIEWHIGDPLLNPERVAAACEISVRALHYLFSGSGQSVSDYIWERRLQRCREALQLPAERHRTVTEIALAAGFNSMSHFSAAFRRRFGVTPSDARDAAG